MTLPQNIALSPCLPSDFPTMSKLESEVFYCDPFSKVAFGALRASPENLAIRTESLLKTLEADGRGERVYEYIKVVKKHENGKEEMIGWAAWCFVTPSAEPVLPAPKSLAPGEKKPNRGFGISANLKFCTDVFIVSDEWIINSTKGKPYAKLAVLLISPSYQRMGIGTHMLSTGLEEVDRRGVQCVLGASPEGEGLYKRFGFEEVGMMRLKLWEYEGGEGMGETRHGVMRREARE